MSHEWDPDKSEDYLQSILDRGGSMDAVSRALAKDAVAYSQEFMQLKTLIPFGYQVNEEGRWTDDGGKTLEELNDPDDVGGDRIGTTLLAEAGIMNNPDVKMAAWASPDLGFGRSYVYVYSRGEGNTIKALAIEFQGGNDQLQGFFRGLGIQGNADVSESSDFSKPMFFTREITPADILTEAKNNTTPDGQQSEYIHRLSRDVMSYPLILEETQRQIEQIAGASIERMLQEETVRQGLAAAVYGAIEMVSDTGTTTVRNVYKDTLQTAGDVIRYVERQQTRTDEVAENTPTEYSFGSPRETLQILLSDETSLPFITLSTEPADSAFETMTESEQSAVWKKTAADILQITAEQSDRLLTEVQETWTRMDEARSVIGLALQTHAGIAAIFAAIDVMTLSDLSRDVTEFPDPEIPDALPKTEPVNAEPDHAKNVFDLLLPDENEKSVQDKPSAHPEFTHISEEFSAPDSVDMVTARKTVDFIHRIETFPEPEQERILKEETAQTTVKMQALEEMLALLIRRAERGQAVMKMCDSQAGDQPFSGIQEESAGEIARSVEQFAIAFTFLLLFKYMNYYSSLESLKHFFDGRKQRRASGDDVPVLPLSAELKKEKPDGLFQKEPAPWLLFSIIWHLAMIREQGMYTTHVPPQKKKKKNTAKKLNPAAPPMQTYGVIFAYNS